MAEEGKIQTIVIDTGARRNEEYLGDGVYISHDDIQIWLRTQRDAGARYGGWDEIALDRGMIRKLVEYQKKIERE